MFSGHAKTLSAKLCPGCGDQWTLHSGWPTGQGHSGQATGFNTTHNVITQFTLSTDASWYHTAGVWRISLHGLWQGCHGNTEPWWVAILESKGFINIDFEKAVMETQNHDGLQYCGLFMWTLTRVVMETQKQCGLQYLGCWWPAETKQLTDQISLLLHGIAGHIALFPDHLLHGPGARLLSAVLPLWKEVKLKLIWSSNAACHGHQQRKTDRAILVLAHLNIQDCVLVNSFCFLVFRSLGPALDFKIWTSRY